METERKFLIDSFPQGEPVKEKFAEQFYICTDPYVRIRRSVSKGEYSYKLTFKGKGTLSRTETEMDITETQFFELKTLCGDARSLRKHTKVYPLPEGLELEVSSVNDGEEGAFMYAEVEFPSEDAARDFLPPSFLGREVTNDDNYKMNNVYARFNTK